MFNDQRVWGDPEVFRPERFLEAETSQRPNPLTMIFGYGMRWALLSNTESEMTNLTLYWSRVCPGMYFADRVTFHIVATIISLFEVVPLEGRTRPDPAMIRYPDTLIRYCTISFEE
jgi:cytochrome P450